MKALSGVRGPASEVGAQRGDAHELVSLWPLCLTSIHTEFTENLSALCVKAFRPTEGTERDRNKVRRTELQGVIGYAGNETRIVCCYDNNNAGF